MLPFLEVESINQKSAIHTKNTTKHNPFETQTEDSQDFAQIFNTLTQPATKKDIKKDSTLKIPLSTQKDDKLMPSKSNFLKILDEKYNLTKDFKSQKIPQPRSAKDLLEFSSTQNKEKTLKDLSAAAKSLQLNLKKISTQSISKPNEKAETKLENTEPNNTTTSKLQSNIQSKPKNNSQKSLFSSILQDKNLATKDSLNSQKTQKEIQEIKQNKESKKTDAKESINTDNTKHNRKLEPKNDSIILDSQKDSKPNEKTQTKAQNSTLEMPKTKLNSKTNTTQEIQETKEDLEPKNTKLDSKVQILQDSKNPQKTQQAQGLQTQNLKQTQEPKPSNTNTNPKEGLESKNSKFDNKPNPTKIDFIAKKYEEVKKDSTLKNENSKETQSLKDTKETRQNPLNQLNIHQETHHHQEQTIKQENFLDNLLKTSQKSQSETKEQIQQPKEKEVRKESEKAHQENYQNSLQAQRESRLSLQNTFTHFSDRLRDAITNYRPPVTKISLELNPQNLGSVELTIAKNGDKLSVQISSNQSALQLIMQNTQDFKNALGNLGFQNVEIDFKDNQGNSLSNGDFSNSSGNQQGGFQQGQQQNSENFKQNSQQNPKNSENWNENSLHIDKKAKNPYAKLAVVELSFSYYA